MHDMYIFLHRSAHAAGVDACAQAQLLAAGAVALLLQRTLEPKNKDRFTQNLTVLRHDYRSKV